jgi:hypothetical protein
MLLLPQEQTAYHAKIQTKLRSFTYRGAANRKSTFTLSLFNVDFGILAIHVKPTAILNAFPWNQSSADMRMIAE